MRDAERTLAVIRDRGSRGLPLEDVYRHHNLDTESIIRAALDVRR